MERKETRPPATSPIRYETTVEVYDDDVKTRRRFVSVVPRAYARIRRNFTRPTSGRDGGGARVEEWPGSKCTSVTYSCCPRYLHHFFFDENARQLNIARHGRVLCILVGYAKMCRILRVSTSPLLTVTRNIFCLFIYIYIRVCACITATEGGRNHTNTRLTVEYNTCAYVCCL